MRDIRSAREAFATAAWNLAAGTVRTPVTPFAPGPRLSRHAHWFVAEDDSILVAVVTTEEKYTVADEVLAYALAWQGDRDLHLVLPKTMVPTTVTRLPWISSPVKVWSHAGGDLTEVRTLARIEVLERLRPLRPRVSKRFELSEEHQQWICDITPSDLDAHDRSYLSWHHRGLQVLKISTRRGGLRIQAGVQYSGRSVTVAPYDRTFDRAPTGTEVAEINAEVAAAVAADGSRSSRMREHRMQATLAYQAADLGLKALHREFPAYRGLDGSPSPRPGRPGYIDFLGVDAQEQFHVIETKIGHDPRVVLQALDYAIWVQAHEPDLRRGMGLDASDAGHSPHARLPQMHLILGADSKGLAFNGYLAPQLEALSGDCRVRVQLVPDVEATPLQLQALAPADYWIKAPMVANPVRGPRWAGRLNDDLRATP